MSLSSNTTIVTRDSSDSNRRNEPFQSTCTKKRRRSHHTVHSARYKGVVVQPNRNWGAQIYFNNERIWLGTFKSEKEAGMAYDSAALKLRNGDSDRNLPPLTLHEPHFQSRFTTEAILNMIKDGSYPSRLANYVNAQAKIEHRHFKVDPQPHSGGGYFSKLLFRKELTPSDVGKLNRLVIPKKAALKFFPPIPKGEFGESAEEVQLTFHDRSMRAWRFRYCYWKSSQSFVFTRGWNRFVSVNDLRAQDAIIFSMCELRDDNNNEITVFYVIEVGRKNPSETNSIDEGLINSENANGPVDLIRSIGFDSAAAEGNNGNSLDGEKEIGGDYEEVNKKGFRLFGVQIA